MVRHMNYHAYHTRLLSIGFNGRATLKLLRCKKDSTRRNLLPPLLCDHQCMWTECTQTFNSIQKHICSWAGCGATFPRRVLLTTHCRSHTGERQIACYHCGQHFCNNRKLMDHLRRQCATQYLLDQHQRSHVSMYACALCDMSAQGPAALAHHVRYRHLAPEDTRNHACHLCEYKAITKWDLRKHVKTHTRKRKKRDPANSDGELSDQSEPEVKKKPPKKYGCHICPKNQMKVYSRGTELTTHLKIVDGGPKKSLTATTLDFTLQKTSEATYTTPTKFEIVLNGSDANVKKEIEPQEEQNNYEITISDVDDKGNIIKSEIFKSDVVFG
ncbi:MBD2-interacting zinc finger protein [Operophtera brumata]|uniref:MBD2-interacting zinc finger protein n=1 Tax=Operophtera brumata TaxID=104452 RepID=A0A0L7L7V9_OPEBR|nr:MBD2-interacting zinc finger protein [Operophtera brumata]